jgi:hypothetical protein
MTKSIFIFLISAIQMTSAFGFEVEKLQCESEVAAEVQKYLSSGEFEGMNKSYGKAITWKAEIQTTGSRKTEVYNYVLSVTDDDNWTYNYFLTYTAQRLRNSTSCSNVKKINEFQVPCELTAIEGSSKIICMQRK